MPFLRKALQFFHQICSEKPRLRAGVKGAGRNAGARLEISEILYKITV